MGAQFPTANAPLAKPTPSREAAKAVQCSAANVPLARPTPSRAAAKAVRFSAAGDLLAKRLVEAAKRKRATMRPRVVDLTADDVGNSDSEEGRQPDLDDDAVMPDHTAVALTSELESVRKAMAMAETALAIAENAQMSGSSFREKAAVAVAEAAMGGVELAVATAVAAARGG